MVKPGQQKLADQVFLLLTGPSFIVRQAVMTRIIPAQVHFDEHGDEPPKLVVAESGSDLSNLISDRGIEIKQEPGDFMDDCSALDPDNHEIAGLLGNYAPASHCPAWAWSSSPGESNLCPSWRSHTWRLQQRRKRGLYSFRWLLIERCIKFRKQRQSETNGN